MNPEFRKGERVRLLKFLTLFGIGGTEKQVINLIKNLDSERYETCFGCLKRWGGLLDEIDSQKLDVFEYPIRSFYQPRSFVQQYKFMRLLRRRRIQIMHSYNFYSNVFSIPAAKAAKVPLVVASVRDMGVYLTPAQIRVQRWVCRMADAVVVNAEAIRGWLVDQGLNAEKISVIRNGVDLEKFDGSFDGNHIKAEFGIPLDSPVVLMLSRLNPKKGIDYFLEAAAQLRKRYPDAYFLVVGDEFTRNGDTRIPDAGYRRLLQDTAEELGIGDRVRFTGMRSDIPEILAAASVSVLPSFTEGISNTILESMAAGVPVVATRVGGTPEIIDDQEHGLLIPPGDVSALSHAVGSILSNSELARRVSTQGRRRIERCFSMEKMVDATQALYESLMRNRPLLGVTQET